MNLITNTPFKALAGIVHFTPNREEITLFKTNFSELINKLKTIEKLPIDETEEHMKNDLISFLRETYYKETNAVNTKGKKDLAVYSEKLVSSDISVIIETKRPSNLDEMITSEDLNRTAFHELIYYYLQERDNGNNELTRLIITNIHEWYIFDVNEFDNKINKGPIEKLYRQKKLQRKSNPWFYEAISKIIESKDITIKCLYFKLNDYTKFLKSDNKDDEKRLIELYKIFTPQYLLKKRIENDSNTLNKKFYDELLYIIGLEEITIGSKSVIQKRELKVENGSIIELIISKLKTKGLHKVTNLSRYGNTESEQIFGISLELCITWINRILFLKLLEGQLLKYNSINKEKDASYSFLNIKIISDFDELFNLFHKVLAIDVKNRDERFVEKYSKVPYLNSSLFEISELEDQSICIDSIDNSINLNYEKNTILEAYRKDGIQFKTLEYVFKFLDSYDFSTEEVEYVAENNKSLITASVLGKVFEKINGYKDGAVFTPSIITTYMCEQSIDKAIVDKFNLIKNWEVNDIDELSIKIKNLNDREEANSIINSLKICDPSVGSGHFLVSALNRIIVIKSYLQILFYHDSKRILNDYSINIINDELEIRDVNNEIFKYNPKNSDSNKIQKTIFLEKQQIIENSLFGVDINNNSVKICRLRLWIELLKNSYYKEESGYTELETLPNLDINIKCGDSLINRFYIHEDIFDKIPNFNKKLKDYKFWVNEYKNAKDKKLKRQLIDNIRIFIDEFKKRDLRVLKLQKEIEKKSHEYYEKFTKNTLFKEDRVKKLEILKLKMESEIEKLSQNLEKIKSETFYSEAFEWRFEFPEILDDSGNFEGFDIIIGNPPYIDSETMVKNGAEDVRLHLTEKYKFCKGNWDIYIAFFNLSFDLLNKNGNLNFITPDKWISKPFGDAMRLELINNLVSITEFGRKVFDTAKVDSIITFITKANSESIIINKANQTSITKCLEINKSNLEKPYTLDWLFSNHIDIIYKIDCQPNKLSKIAVCENACATSDAYKIKEFIKDGTKVENATELSLKIINTGTIGKYVSKWGIKEMTYLKDKYQEPIVFKDVFNENFKNSYGIKSLLPKLIIKGLTLLDACIDFSGEIIPGKSTMVITKPKGEEKSLLFPLALLNSKVIFFYIKEKYRGSSYNQGINFSTDMINNIPLPNISLQLENKVNDIISSILENHSNENIVKSLEEDLNLLFYKIYDLSYNQIKEIDPDFNLSEEDYTNFENFNLN
jgi:adenine-specific DNA-methyltransferase